MADVRASDEDRTQTVAALQRHTAAGRLTLDEFADRAGLAWQAITRTDLLAVLHDLPPDSPETSAAPSTGQAGPGRELLVAFLIAGIVVLALAIVLTIAR